MPRFRPRLTSPTPPPAAAPDLLAVGQLIDELMQPGHFFVAPSLCLHWTGAKTEDVPWEVFRGRLLASSQTRRQARFLSWHVTAEDGNPMLSVRLDVYAGVAHVTRGILCYVWEAYDAGDNVIQSREVQRWTTELVGAAELDRFPDIEELRDELVCLIWQAIVGTSKLPLHSVESPLPAFTFGQLYYCYRPWVEDVAEPMHDWQTLLDDMSRPELSDRERARVLEFLLRHIESREQAAALAQQFRRRAAEGTRLLRRVFRDVSLSPYTEFVGTALNFVWRLHCASADPQRALLLSFHTHLLRQLARHLTAYDLVTFHHAGANYPDALLLDAILSYHFLHEAGSGPELFLSDNLTQRLRRRALRQACLLRHHYELHAVPDVPTSPGENQRVLPNPYHRVPEQQLQHSHTRGRRLYADDPLTARLHRLDEVRRVFTQSIIDLQHPAERTELGIGLFIDRPLGYGKATGEPDYTPMLAHEAFSVSIARKRVKELAILARELALDVPADLFESVDHALQTTPVHGLLAARLAEPGRPTAALADVRRVADDFVIVRTLPGGLREMLGYFNFGSLLQRLPRVVAMVHSPRGPVLGFFDDDYQLQMEAVVDESAGFFRRAGVELPVAGLRVRAGGDEARIPLAG